MALPHIPPLFAKRSLASLIVLAMSLMSLGVDSCETSCLVSHAQCAEDSTQSTASAQPMSSPSMGMRESSASQVPGMESVSCRSDEFCKDASTSVMRPTSRAELQKARWASFGAVFAVSEAPGEYLVNQSASPPPRTTDPLRFLMTLRI